MKYLFAAATAVMMASFPCVTSASDLSLGTTSTAQACYHAARDYRSDLNSLRICDQALNVNTSSDTVANLVNRGIIHMLRGEHGGALRDFDAALALDPREPEALLNKGMLLLRKPGNEAMALELVNAALELKTAKPAVAYFVRAGAHEDMGNYTAAYRDYERAAKLDPEWKLPADNLKRFAVKRRA